MYRFFELIPGTLTWVTLIAIVLCSWQLPVGTSIFIILFDIYWLLKTIYLSLHLRVTFNHMRANMKVDWLEKLAVIPAKAGIQWSDIYHLIIFPMYKEPHAVVRESFESLVKAQYPKDKFLVVLATEEAGGEEVQETARKIQEEFGHEFAKFLITTHPKNVPGELAGKGSNEAYSAREAQKLLIDPKQIPYANILVSVFDIDTQNYPHYFSRLTYCFLNEPENSRLRSIYQPIPLFINNIYQAPSFARVVSFSTTFWQMMQQARPERLTSFSSQSIPFTALVDMDFWNVNVVSEDSRVFWQGYLRYSGDFRVVPMEYPVSMDANVAPTFWGTMRSLYKQQRRWAWGSENVPYMLTGFSKDKKIPLGKKWYWSFISIEGYHSWATNTLMIFALGWLPTLIGAGGFSHSLLSFSLPRITRLIVGLSTLGIAASAILSILLLPPTTEKRGARYVIYLLEWILIPVTLIIFGAFPAIEAQTRLMLGGKYRLGFWVTPKGRYKS